VAGVTASIERAESAATEFLAVSGDLRKQSGDIADMIREFFEDIRRTTGAGAGDDAKGRRAA
jgi:hypothetical protein